MCKSISIIYFWLIIIWYSWYFVVHIFSNGWGKQYLMKFFVINRKTNSSIILIAINWRYKLSYIAHQWRSKFDELNADVNEKWNHNKLQVISRLQYRFQQWNMTFIISLAIVEFNEITFEDGWQSILQVKHVIELMCNINQLKGLQWHNTFTNENADL